MLIGVIILSGAIVGISQATYDLRFLPILKFTSHFGDKKVWRVQYTCNAKWTRLITKQEAKYLAKAYGGVKYVDFNKGYW